MNHAEAVERAALAFQAMLGWPKTSPHEVYVEKAAEILAASGYPAALTAATERLTDLLAFLDKFYGENHRVFTADDGSQLCSACPTSVGAWPCPVERARVGLADHEDTT